MSIGFPLFPRGHVCISTIRRSIHYLPKIILHSHHGRFKDLIKALKFKRIVPKENYLQGFKQVQGGSGRASVLLSLFPGSAFGIWLSIIKSELVRSLFVGMLQRGLNLGILQKDSWFSENEVRCLYQASPTPQKSQK